MMKILFYLIPGLYLSFFNFKMTDNEACRAQGIKGYIFKISGNQMPSPDLPPSKPAGFKTELYVFELTNLDQTVKEGIFFKALLTKQITIIHTNEKGYYKAKLKPGIYSLFVKKGDLFYSNILDGNNNIHPVEVKKGKWTTEDFKVDYSATY